MNYRSLGNTGIQVSEIGYGAWGIGGDLWQGNDDAEALTALHRATEFGLNFVDTALAYGKGHSERLIARFLKEHKGRIYVATKIPPKNGKWPAEPGSKLHDVFPADYVIKCTEKSLQNLQVDTIDVQQFHVWNDDWSLDNEWWDAIQQLKRHGKIKHFGVSINDHQPENAVKLAESGRAETLQVIYNIFDQSPARKLFEASQKLNIGVIVRVPFDEGSLTGNITSETTFPPGDFRNRYFGGSRRKQVVDRIEKLRAFLGDEAETLSELALRFCLNHPAVSTVIPGMRTTKHVEANCLVSDGRVLTASLLSELKKHAWERNFYRAD